MPPNYTLIVDTGPNESPDLGGMFVRGKVTFQPSTAVPHVELRAAWVIVGTDSTT